MQEKKKEAEFARAEADYIRATAERDQAKIDATRHEARLNELKAQLDADALARSGRIAKSPAEHLLRIQKDFQQGEAQIVAMGLPDEDTEALIDHLKLIRAAELDKLKPVE
jgi:hypothetical protein